MDKLFKHLLLPILIAAVASSIATIGIISKQINDKKSIFDYWTIVIFSCMMLSLALVIIQAILKYKEEIKKLETVKFTLKLKDLRPPKQLPETWNSDPKYSSGCLTVYIQDDENFQLLQKFVRYGELIDPTSPAEWEYSTEVKTKKYNASIKVGAKTILLTFEPSMVRSRKLYDSDDIHDWLDEAPTKSNGDQQVIIYTESAQDRFDELIKTITEPEKTLRVKTNHRPYHELDMPVIFTLPQEISLCLNNDTVFTLLTENLKCNHEYVLSVRSDNDGWLEKQLYYYSISTEMKNSS